MSARKMETEEVVKEHQDATDSVTIIETTRKKQNRPNLLQIMKEAITRINPQGGITQKEMVAYINGKLGLEPTVARQKIKKVLRSNNSIVQNYNTRLVIGNKVCCDMVRPKPCIRGVKWRPKIPKMYNQKKAHSPTRRYGSHGVCRSCERKRRYNHYRHHHRAASAAHFMEQQKKHRKGFSQRTMSSRHWSRSVPSEHALFQSTPYEAHEATQSEEGQSEERESSHTEAAESKSASSESTPFEFEPYDVSQYEE
ncbi:unnamed protein product [Nezara viridula]|uniref:H15 domain-containing protein n=1 Tax=Nezara viridula TaxID=85310 RepID=A0A9P0HQC9_NEZVI|nr:unnamed protein product [Nezara viridula]